MLYPRRSLYINIFIAGFDQLIDLSPEVHFVHRVFIILKSSYVFLEIPFRYLYFRVLVSLLVSMRFPSHCSGAIH